MQMGPNNESEYQRVLQESQSRKVKIHHREHTGDRYINSVLTHKHGSSQGADPHPVWNGLFFHLRQCFLREIVRHLGEMYPQFAALQPHTPTKGHHYQINRIHDCLKNVRKFFSLHRSLFFRLTLQPCYQPDPSTQVQPREAKLSPFSGNLTSTAAPTSTHPRFNLAVADWWGKNL